MQPTFSILFLLLTSLLALPTSAIQACGNPGLDWEKTAAPTTDEHCATTGDSCQETHPDEDCPPDTDGCGHCHCPGCGATSMAATGFFKNTLPEFSALSRLYSNGAANFCYRTPSTSAHLAALFRPPISGLF